MKRKSVNILVSMILLALVAAAILPAGASAAAVVSVTTFSTHAIMQTPPDDADAEGGAAYRSGSNGNAPFVVIAQIAGANGQRVKFWLADDQSGNTVDTYNRFGGSCSPNFTSASCWLLESGAFNVNWIDVTAANFYVMVVGRFPGGNTGNRMLTLYYQIDANGDGVSDSSGTVDFGPVNALAGGSSDWFQNWDDTGSPESGDPRPNIDYVELKVNGVSYATAPADTAGYFQVTLGNNTNGATVVAEGRTEGGGSGYSWVQTVVSSSGAFNELIYAGSGSPTAVRLHELSASSGHGRWTLPLFAGLLLILAGVGLFVRRWSERQIA